MPLQTAVAAEPALIGQAPRGNCARCAASCCRLTVVLMPADRVAAELTATQNGVAVMARGSDGLCVAVDRVRMCCSIYDARPAACHRFAMNGGYCRSIRSLTGDLNRSIPTTLS